MAERRRRRPGDDWFICPQCGARVRASASSCPECGSDDETGWKEDAWAENVELPDAPPETDDELDELYERAEVPGYRRASAARASLLFRILLAIALLAALVIAFR